MASNRFIHKTGPRTLVDLATHSLFLVVSKILPENTRNVKRCHLCKFNIKNDNFDEGETVFPQFGLQVKPKKGTVLLFPCTWSYLHKGNPSTNGYAKYILGSFLNYMNHQRFDRIGDKNLGIENI